MDYISILPVELSLEILSYLCATDLAHVRAINKTHSVLLKRQGERLSKAIMNRERYRLRRSMLRPCDDGCTLETMIRDYLQNDGLPSEDEFRRRATCMANEFCNRNWCIPPHTTRRIVEAVLYLNYYFHRRSTPNMLKRHASYFNQVNVRLICQRACASEPELGAKWFAETIVCRCMDPWNRPELVRQLREIYESIRVKPLEGEYLPECQKGLLLETFKAALIPPLKPLQWHKKTEDVVGMFWKKMDFPDAGDEFNYVPRSIATAGLAKHFFRRKFRPGRRAIHELRPTRDNLLVAAIWEEMRLLPAV